MNWNFKTLFFLRSSKKYYVPSSLEPSSISCKIKLESFLLKTSITCERKYFPSATLFFALRYLKCIRSSFQFIALGRTSERKFLLLAFHESLLYAFYVLNLELRRGGIRKKVKKNIKQMPFKPNLISFYSVSNYWSNPAWHILLLVLWLFTDLTVSSLGMVHVTIPGAIQSGRNAILTCDYELEDDDLYSVKWYKGKREFFRYTPKEIPSIKTFRIPGIRVDVSWWFATTLSLYLITYADHDLPLSYEILSRAREKKMLSSSCGQQK